MMILKRLWFVKSVVIMSKRYSAMLMSKSID